MLEFGSALLGAADGIPDPDLAQSRGEARILWFPSDAKEVSGVARLAQVLLEEQPNSRILVAVPSRRAAAAFYAGLQEAGVPCENRATNSDELDDQCRLARAYARLLKEPNDSVAAATAIVLNCAISARRVRSQELLELGYDRSERIAALFRSEFVPPGPLGRGIVSARLSLGRLRESKNLDDALAELTGCANVEAKSDQDGGRESFAVNPGSVTLMTVHSCKGLQADVTILPSVEPGSYERGPCGSS